MKKSSFLTIACIMIGIGLFTACNLSDMTIPKYISENQNDDSSDDVPWVPVLEIVAVVPSATSSSNAFTLYWTCDDNEEDVLKYRVKEASGQEYTINKTGTGWEDTSGSGTNTSPYMTPITLGSPVSNTAVFSLNSMDASGGILSSDSEDPSADYTAKPLPIYVTPDGTATGAVKNAPATLDSAFAYILSRYSHVTMNVMGEIRTSTGGPYSIASGKTLFIKPDESGKDNGIIKDTNTGSLFTVMGTLTIQGADEDNTLTLKGFNGTSSSALVVVNTGGTLIMNDYAVITGNKNNLMLSDYGGGVFVSGSNIAPAVFTMNGGEISNNSADNGGGVYVDAWGEFTMNGGIIGTTEGNVTDSYEASEDFLSNSAYNYGGGVFVDADGEFTMTDGTIAQNLAMTDGGGVFVDADGWITMSGGIIGGGTASDGDGNWAKGGSSGGIEIQGSYSLGDGIIENNYPSDFNS